MTTEKTTRTAARKPATDPGAERARQRAARAEKEARSAQPAETPAAPETPAEAPPVAAETQAVPLDSPEGKAAVEAGLDNPPAGSFAEAAKPKRTRKPAAKPEAPKPPRKRTRPAAAKPEVPEAPEGETITKDDVAAAKAEAIAEHAKGIDGNSPAAERHAAVKALHATGIFTFVEIAKATGYANGGVVRNLIYPPARKGVEPLSDEALVAVRALETALGMSIREIARRVPKD